LEGADQYAPRCQVDQGSQEGSRRLDESTTGFASSEELKGCLDE
jgi:hypothetical protein